MKRNVAGSVNKATETPKKRRIHLTNSAKRTILTLVDEKRLTKTAIAEQYKISKSALYNIINRRSEVLCNNNSGSKRINPTARTTDKNSASKRATNKKSASRRPNLTTRARTPKLKKKTLAGASYFADKVVIVTGSGSGIGKAIAEALFAAGAIVVCNSRSLSSQRVAENLDKTQQRAKSFVGDLSKDAVCRRVIAQTIDSFGRLDILVNNAGKNHPVKHTNLEGVTEDALRGVFEINTFGTFYMCRAAMPYLKASGDGSILNITSVAGIRPGGSSMPYSMSKAATNHLTLMLAKSFAPEVRVNAIAPGLTDTPLMASDVHTAKKAFVADRSPMKRIAVPNDIAEMALGVLQSRFTTGQIVTVDGGYSLKN